MTTENLEMKISNSKDNSFSNFDSPSPHKNSQNFNEQINNMYKNKRKRSLKENYDYAFQEEQKTAKFFKFENVEISEFQLPVENENEINVNFIDEIKENYTIAIVTHSMQQAARVSQRTAYFHLGKLVEVGATKDIFTVPKHQLTENYITGRFG